MAREAPLSDALQEVRRLGKGNFRIEGHAKHAMLDDDVTLADVRHVLFASGIAATGGNRTRFCERRKTWTYTIEGFDLNDRWLRIAIYFEKVEPLPNEMVVVLTVMEIKRK